MPEGPLARYDLMRLVAVVADMSDWSKEIIIFGDWYFAERRLFATVLLLFPLMFLISQVW